MGDLEAEFAPRGYRLPRIGSAHKLVCSGADYGGSRCADSSQEAKIPGLSGPETPPSG